MPSVSLSCDAHHDQASGAGARGYTFDVTAGVITDTSAGLATVATSSGQTSGPFFEGTPANFAALQCKYDTSLICPYRIWDSLSVFYTYRTGPQSTRPILMTQSATPTPILFDAPKIFSYVHQGTTSNSGQSYQGTKFLLQYQGRGDLSGLPTMCIDTSTGLPGSCYPSASTSIVDLDISPNGILKGINGGASINDMSFYSKPTELAEYYPYYTNATGALDNNPCIAASLEFDNYVNVASEWNSLFAIPPWTSKPFPTSAELANNYFLAGKPAVIKGEPIWALPGMDGKCPA
jgi:hypothetical protein